MLAWLTGTVELWLAFTVLGRPIDWVEAVILESVGQAARSAGFMIPGGLGVQEGGMIAAGAWVGVPTEVALAVGLLKRARELAYGVPGLLVWPLIRTRSRRATAVTEIG